MFMSMQSLLTASMSLSKMQVMQSVNTKVQGQISVLKAEIKMDGGNYKKEEKVEQLTQKSSELVGSMMEELKNTNTQLTTPEEEKPSNMDQVDISHKTENTGKEEGEEKDGNIQASSAVSYDAEGKKTEKAEAKPGEKMDVKA